MTACSSHLRHITLFIIINFLSLTEDTSKTVTVGLVLLLEVGNGQGTKNAADQKEKKMSENHEDRMNFSDTT